MSMETILKRLSNIMRTDDGINGDAQRLEQIVWMLFLKLFDSKEEEWEIKELLHNMKYDSIIPTKLRWKSWALKEDGMTGEELLEFVDRTLFPTLKNIEVKSNKHQTVRNIFTDTHNYMKSGTLLRQIINIINEIDFNTQTDRHQFNDIYETMLRELQSAGNAGEFYTPRPVTQFVVDMIQPKINERILDFACGTGGFLTCTLDYFERTNQIGSADDMLKIQNNLKGIEKKQLPHALCMTNLLLHGIDIPNIERRNSLAGQVYGFADKDMVDVILTNPPYGGTEEAGIQTSFAKEYRTSETADLFMALLMEKLSDNGRAGIVLPDSILFGDGVKNNIKSRLLKEFNLHTIVRLPAGVFSPYTSITTNLLFLEKGKPTKEIWYYEIPLPEGYKSFSKTKPITNSHFEPIKEWWNNRIENENAWLVKVEEIKNYNLDIKNPNKVDETDNMSIEDLILKMKEAINENQEIMDQIEDVLND